jgi:hypothetical protein
VLPLTAPDAIPLAERARLAEAVLVGLRRGETETVSIKAAADCDASCRAGLADEAKAKHVVRVSLSQAGPDWKIHGELFSGSGQTQGQSEATCEICGTAELAETVEDVAAGLATEARMVGSLAELELTGEPSGAKVFVDGQDLGNTPFRGTFPPGEHAIVLKKRGFADQTLKWSGRQGVSESIQYTLGSNVRGAESDAQQRKLQRMSVRQASAEPLGWLGVGVGAAALGAGIGLIVIHGRDHAQTCIEGFRDPQGDCPFTYQTMVPGAVLAAAGVGLVAGAATAIAISRKRRKNRSEAPTVTAAASPRSITLRVRF